MAPERRLAVRVSGRVQGVGFRPAVYRLARRHGLVGLVRNDPGGVSIEVEGEAVARFVEDLPLAAPLATLERIETWEAPLRGDLEFRILPSEDRADGLARVPADLAACDACLAEVGDPDDRRHRHPFASCTGCGPRYALLAGELPWDRARTTMSAFPMCSRCAAEHADPEDRRFHAEANACPGCGPRLGWSGAGEPLAEACRMLQAGGIVAVKGIGGYHLAVRADDEAAVGRLRERKRRPHRPFALLARDLAVAGRLVVLDDVVRDALAGPARPIVLAPRRLRAPVAPSVAPGVAELGVMLPYTPLHRLLLEELGAVVLTSANLAEEPVATDDDDVRARLAHLVDGVLSHDRCIPRPVEDSVVRAAGGRIHPVRRSRGHVPDPVALGFSGPSVLAVGGELKVAIGVTRGDQAFLSPHLGDLSHPRALDGFTDAIRHLTALHRVAPAIVAHDLHPDYASTRWALACGLRRVGVQHHHAHVASCLVDNGRTGPVIGVAFDGTGCGPAGELWGGELLLADLAGFRRLGHLRALRVPGGERAIREPWRLAVAALVDAGEDPSQVPGADRRQVEQLTRLIARGAACPPATSAGRWFDAVAALCGVRASITYEAQAAVELEAVARGEGDPYPVEVGEEIDLRPTVRAIAADLRDGVEVPRVSARFHATLAAAVQRACGRFAEETGVREVALSGGCFQNARLASEVEQRLRSDGFEVWTHRRVPCNDGGLALGQAAVAAWRERDVPRGAG